MAGWRKVSQRTCQGTPQGVVPCSSYRLGFHGVLQRYSSKLRSPHNNGPTKESLEAVMLVCPIPSELAVLQNETTSRTRNTLGPHPESAWICACCCCPTRSFLSWQLFFRSNKPRDLSVTSQFYQLVGSPSVYRTSNAGLCLSLYLPIFLMPTIKPSNQATCHFREENVSSHHSSSHPMMDVLASSCS